MRERKSIEETRADLTTMLDGIHAIEKEFLDLQLRRFADHPEANRLGPHFNPEYLRIHELRNEVAYRRSQYSQAVVRAYERHRKGDAPQGRATIRDQYFNQKCANPECDNMVTRHKSSAKDLDHSLVCCSGKCAHRRRKLGITSADPDSPATPPAAP